MIAIIGAGASGLVGAIEAAKGGAKVVVFEKNNKIGKKILASGNGRCNISNQNITFQNYHGSNPAFVKHALNLFDTQKCKKFFHSLGLEIKESESGKLFPHSLQASAVVSHLEYEAIRLGVQIQINSEVKKIDKTDEGFILHVDDKSLHVKRVLIAAGGIAMPNLGASDSGYKLAQSFGHSIEEPFGALTQLVSKENFKELSGVKIESEASIFVNRKLENSYFGDILFTNYGLSGAAILDASREIGSLLKLNQEIKIKLDLLPEYSKEHLRATLEKRLLFAHDKQLHLWLSGLINLKLAKYIASRFNNKPASQINKKDLNKLVYELKEFEVNIEASRGLESAEVTAGGIDVTEVSNTTMESKLVSGLYFSGEVLDIDGDCGGFNLHWAWASGYLAGKSMIQ